MPAGAGRQDGDRELTITRIYDAPAHLLFEAWSRPEHLMRWFGPVGWPVTLCEVDFRKGGRWRMAMTGPSGEQNEPFGGVYLEIVPDRKIVFDNAFEGNPAKKMVMTVTFEETAGRTTLTWHTLFMSPAMKDEYVGMGIEAGANSGLDQLETLARGLT
ncbi:MAG: SRPBCC domain-containing protein [Pseudomonadota bacterium]